jgi:hypothetical protein
MKMKIQKTYLLCLAVLLTMTACQPLRFDRFPGEAQQEIPEAYRGKYVFYNKDLLADTTTVYIGKNSFTQIQKDNTRIDFLDEQHVFSAYKQQSFYFSQENERWSGFFIGKSGDDVIVTPIIVTKDNKNPERTLRKYFPDVRMVEDTGRLEKQSYYVRMDEEGLMKYMKKLKKQKFLLKKVPY